MIYADIPKADAYRHDDWVALCGVCESGFVVPKSDSTNCPAPNGSFCPDCRHRGLKAPGVLHWDIRSTEATR